MNNFRKNKPNVVFKTKKKIIIYKLKRVFSFFYILGNLKKKKKTFEKGMKIAKGTVAYSVIVCLIGKREIILFKPNKTMIEPVFMGESISQ